MRHRQAPRSPIPVHWLMLDARLGDAMIAAARALPPRSGIILRPQAMTADQQKPAILRRLRAIARARRHILLSSGIQRPGYDGVHNPTRKRAAAGDALWRTQAVHTARQAALARRQGIDVVLISPIFATRSHAGAMGIGAARFTQLSRQCGGGIAAIALGGMTAERYRGLRRHGAHGWAAIDAWLNA